MQAPVYTHSLKLVQQQVTNRTFPNCFSSSYIFPQWRVVLFVLPRPRLAWDGVQLRQQGWPHLGKIPTCWQTGMLTEQPFAFLYTNKEAPEERDSPVWFKFTIKKSASTMVSVVCNCLPWRHHCGWPSRVCQKGSCLFQDTMQLMPVLNSNESN